MAELIPVNKPLGRDLVLDMNNSSVPSYDGMPDLLTQDWYGAVLMHHMFSPNSQDPLQRSGVDSDDEDITKRIMQEWYQNQSKAGLYGRNPAQSRRPSSSRTSKLWTSKGSTLLYSQSAVHAHCS